MCEYFTSIYYVYVLLRAPEENCSSGGHPGVLLERQLQPRNLMCIPHCWIVLQCLAMIMFGEHFDSHPKHRRTTQQWGIHISLRGDSCLPNNTPGWPQLLQFPSGARSNMYA